eukprot:8131-Prorocentrum_minimum.AAC.1
MLAGSPPIRTVFRTLYTRPVLSAHVLLASSTISSALVLLPRLPVEAVGAAPTPEAPAPSGTSNIGAFSSWGIGCGGARSCGDCKQCVVVRCVTIDKS